MKIISISKERQVSLDGMMTISQLENGLHIADFMNCEGVNLEPFSGTFKLEAKHDGNIYLTEKPKRVRNKPLFRDDNASLTRGQDGRWYFHFSLDEDQLGQLPAKLVQQSGALAEKFIRTVLYQGKKRRVNG